MNANDIVSLINVVLGVIALFMIWIALHNLNESLERNVQILNATIRAIEIRVNLPYQPLSNTPHRMHGSLARDIADGLGMHAARERALQMSHALQADADADQGN